MRLRPGTPVTAGCLPGVWVALHTVRDRPGWWRIVPKTSTPGLVKLSESCTMEIHRRELTPLLQEALPL